MGHSCRCIHHVSLMLNIRVLSQPECQRRQCSILKPAQIRRPLVPTAVEFQYSPVATCPFRGGFGLAVAAVVGVVLSRRRLQCPREPCDQGCAVQLKAACRCGIVVRLWPRVAAEPGLPMAALKSATWRRAVPCHRTTGAGHRAPAGGHHVGAMVITVIELSECCTAAALPIAAGSGSGCCGRGGWRTRTSRSARGDLKCLALTRLPRDLACRCRDGAAVGAWARLTPQRLRARRSPAFAAFPIAVTVEFMKSPTQAIAGLAAKEL